MESGKNKNTIPFIIIREIKEEIECRFSGMNIIEIKTIQILKNFFFFFLSSIYFLLLNILSHITIFIILIYIIFIYYC